MRQYLDLLQKVLDEGSSKQDRTGTGTLSIFGCQSRYDLSAGFPLLTTKKLHLRSIIHELLWFIAGDTNVAYLQQNGVRIWDEWADENGELGPVYGRQWRSWPTADGGSIDQLAQVVEQVRHNPDSRRMLVSSWNPGEIEGMALPPCHLLFQFYVCDGRLSCQMYQRSADLFLGVPFNVASYSLLTMMVAQVTGLEPGEFIHTLGDTHLYLNHLDQAREQLSRLPGPLPTMMINPEVNGGKRGHVLVPREPEIFFNKALKTQFIAVQVRTIVVLQRARKIAARVGNRNSDTYSTKINGC